MTYTCAHGYLMAREEGTYKNLFSVLPINHHYQLKVESSQMNLKKETTLYNR